MKLDLYNQKGENIGTVEAPKSCFEVPFKNGLIHEALLRQLSNARKPIAHTKNKAEVHGGGRKPYPQKGTGRARQGSIRNPHYKGGGVAFGPRNTRNFEKGLPRGQRRLALTSALSQKAREKGVIVLDTFTNDKPSTKVFATMLKKLPVRTKTLIVLSGHNDLIETSSRNIPRVKTLLASYLNIKDLQSFKSIIFLQDAIDSVAKTFAS